MEMAKQNDCLSCYPISIWMVNSNRKFTEQGILNVWKITEQSTKEQFTVNQLTAGIQMISLVYFNFVGAFAMKLIVCICLSYLLAYCMNSIMLQTFYIYMGYYTYITNAIMHVRYWFIFEMLYFIKSHHKKNLSFPYTNCYNEYVKHHRFRNAYLFHHMHIKCINIYRHGYQTLNVRINKDSILQPFQFTCLTYSFIYTLKAQTTDYNVLTVILKYNI